MSAPAILLTRPQAEAEKLARDLAAQGWRPMLWPLIEIVTLECASVPSGAQAVIFSSANAVRRVAPAPVVALCVGEATAEAARAAGFADVRSADGDAAALIALARGSLRAKEGPVLIARGENVAADIAGALVEEGFAVREAVVYAARPTRSAPPDIAAALAAGAVNVATFYSARTARIFAGFAAPWRSGLAACGAVAISARAAAELTPLGFGRIVTAERPDGAAMLRAIADARPSGATI